MYLFKALTLEPYILADLSISRNTISILCETRSKTSISPISLLIRADLLTHQRNSLLGILEIHNQQESHQETLHLRFALAERNLTGIFTGFYNVLVHYFQYLANNYEVLINDIEKGTIDASVEMPESVRESVLKQIQPG